jgi:hypothetical protein
MQRFDRFPRSSPPQRQAQITYLMLKFHSHRLFSSAHGEMVNSPQGGALQSADAAESLKFLVLLSCFALNRDKVSNTYNTIPCLTSLTSSFAA